MCKGKLSINNRFLICIALVLLGLSHPAYSSPNVPALTCLQRSLNRVLADSRENLPKLLYEDKTDSFEPLDTALFYKDSQFIRGKPIIETYDPIRKVKAFVPGSEYILVDTVTGKKVFDSNLVHDVIANDPAVQTRGGVDFFNPTYDHFLSDGQHFVSQVTTNKNNETLIYLYNVHTKDLTLVTEAKRSHNILYAEDKSPFVIISQRRDGQADFNITRIENKKQIVFSAPQNSTSQIGSAKVSKDGNSLLVTNRFDEDTQYHRNDIFPLNWDHSPATKSANVPAISFKGEILASSADLNRFVVDTSNGVRQQYDSVIPKFALVEISGTGTSRKARTTPLVGQQQLQESIKKVAKGGTTISYGTIEAQITPDGRFFSVNIPFESTAKTNKTGYRATMKQNWVGLWDLNSTKEPASIGSGIHFDTLDDLEPSMANYSNLANKELELWGRNFQSRLLDDGTLMIVRAIVQKGAKDAEQGTVNLKVLKVNTKANQEIARPDFYTLGPYNISKARDGSTHRRQGITQFFISPDGHKIGFHLTGEGTKVIELPKTAKSP